MRSGVNVSQSALLECRVVLARGVGFYRGQSGGEPSRTCTVMCQAETRHEQPWMGKAVTTCGAVVWELSGAFSLRLLALEARSVTMPLGMCPQRVKWVKGPSTHTP